MNPSPDGVAENRASANKNEANEQAPVSQENVAKRLLEKGFYSKKAAGVAEAIAARLNGQELTRTQRSLLSSAIDSPTVQSVISDMQKTLISRGDNVSQKPTARNVGQLYATVQMVNDQANASVNQKDVAKGLLEKGFYSKEAAGVAEAVVARLNGQELTRTQRSILSSALSSSAVRDTISEFIQKKADGVDSAQHNVYDEISTIGGNAVTEGLSLRQVRNAFSKRNYESGTDVLDEIKRTGEIVVEFNYNSKYDKIEFARQLADQQKGMKELTVQEYLDNRRKYIEQGRATGSNAAQQAAREKVFADKVDELQDAGLSLKEAEEQAKEWLDTQAALHIPDQVAGGYSGNVGGVGDKGVNASIGAQWRYRISGVDAQIQKIAESMSEAEKNTTYLNVNLIYRGE